MVVEAFSISVAVVIVVLLAELLHARRIRRVATLAFGPSGQASSWARIAPPVKAIAAGLATWGLLMLMTIEPKVHRQAVVDKSKLRHLLILLDVSPSMRLEDAGPSKKQSRRARARDLIESFLARSGADFKITVVAFYTEAKPVVKETVDMEVVRNILSDLPLHYAFDAGNTRLFDGLEAAATIAHPWNPDDCTLLIVTDGDTVPATGMPKLPASINHTLVIGVGDPSAGSFIDGRQSRQDVATQRQTAARLRGEFHDGNEKQIPSNIVRLVSSSGRESPFEALSLREYALMAAALGGALYLAIPLALQRFGTSWRPGVSKLPSQPIKNAKRSTRSQSELLETR